MLLNSPRGRRRPSLAIIFRRTIMGATSPSSPASSEGIPSDGPAGLGQMSSLSAECTPLKHRYDTCFNQWFEEYLSLGTSADPSRLDQTTSSDSGRGGFWSRNKSSSASSAGLDDLERSEKRKQLRTDLDGRCGVIFKEYQACVKVSLSAGKRSACLLWQFTQFPLLLLLVNQKALGDRNILPLISEAREFNPFPFPDLAANANKPNNGPFPFSAASPQERQDWEKKNGW